LRFIQLGTPSGTKSIEVTSASQDFQLLSFSGDASKGINKLYARFLAPKLSIVNGADGSTVMAIISAADSFLAPKNSSDWRSLTRTEKNQVLSWMSTLDDYNNGYIGPTHCE